MQIVELLTSISGKTLLLAEVRSCFCFFSNASELQPLLSKSSKPVLMGEERSEGGCRQSWSTKRRVFVPTDDTSQRIRHSCHWDSCDIQNSLLSGAAVTWMPAGHRSWAVMLSPRSGPEHPAQNLRLGKLLKLLGRKEREALSSTCRTSSA